MIAGEHSGGIVYLVLAHRAPDHFGRLTGRLSSDPGTRVVAHIDRVSDQSPFERAAFAHGGRVEFVTRRDNVRWGGWSQCSATLKMISLALQGPGSHLVLLSGADYPIRRLSDLPPFLAAHPICMDRWPMPDLDRGKPMSRLTRFGVAFKNPDGRLYETLSRLLEVGPPRNVARGLGSLLPYAGSQFWAIPRALAQEIVEFTATHPKITAFFRRSTIPDESFFHTVAAHLRPDAPSMPSLTYTQWTAPNAIHPDILTSADLPAVRSAAVQGHFFARKFDPHVDTDVLDELDRTTTEARREP